VLIGKEKPAHKWLAGRAGWKQSGASVMEWKDQYKHPLWQKKRLEALEESEFVCSRCFDGEAQLHVHHRQYFKGRKIWEYQLNELEVLCDHCHEFTHEEMGFLKTMLSRIPAEAISDVTALLGGFIISGIGPMRVSVQFVNEHVDQIKSSSPYMFSLGLVAGDYSRNTTTEQVFEDAKLVCSFTNSAGDKNG